MLGFFRRFAAVFCLALLPGMAGAEVTVFAASSLKTALDEVVTLWEGERVLVSYGGSSALARQILAGAPADVYISANVGWMDAVEEAGLVQEGTRRDLLGNDLVLVASEPGEVALSAEVLGARLKEGPLAMAMADAVPAGIYGKQALVSLGLWEAVAPQVAQAANVRAALALVALGEAPLGIVYASDAVAEARVHVAARFPQESHDPIIYPVAAVSDVEGAEALLDFLSGAQARAVFERNGFTGIAP
ncbi:MAG: molybdate ABC transporter substrate-binding protein [Rhodobacteraceae bacterium]|nr:molybdate ABC transporter substrate-binding protein [Paracoccaceae bacterium]